MTLMTCSSSSSAAPPLLILMVTKQPIEAVKVHRARVSQYLQRNLKAILLWFSASSSTCLQHSSNYNNHHDRRQLPITFPLLILFTRVTFNLISPSSSGYLCCAQTPSQCGNLLDEQNLSHSGGSTVLPLLPDMVINSIPFPFDQALGICWTSLGAVPACVSLKHSSCIFFSDSTASASGISPFPFIHSV